MRKSKKLTTHKVILGGELGLDEWIALLGTNKRDRVFPNNCFPTDGHKKEYLLRVEQCDEADIKNLARHFLNKSGYYGEKDRFGWVVEHYGAEIFVNEKFVTEFDRRAMPKYGPQWEGITWVLDLLPRNPLDAIAAVRAYVRSHLVHLTDNMIYGHDDVVDIIQAKYGVTAKHSCFISYGGPDGGFAQKLHDSLVDHGVQVFFFPVHATPGQSMYKVMREGINQYDRIILVCSKASLDRPGVLNELTETLRREARDGSKEYLIPIRLDDYVLKGWSPDNKQLAHAVRDRVVADFSGTVDDENKFNMALNKLIVALDRPRA